MSTAGAVEGMHQVFRSLGGRSKSRDRDCPMPIQTLGPVVHHDVLGQIMPWSAGHQRCLLLLVVGEGLLRWARGHAAEGHGEQHGFAFESFSGFYAFFGLVACVALVLAAKELRKLIMRPEDYYGD